MKKLILFVAALFVADLTWAQSVSMDIAKKEGEKPALVERVVSFPKGKKLQPMESKFKLVETISVSTGVAGRFYKRFRFRPELIAKSSKMAPGFIDEYSKLEKQSSQILGNKGIILPRFYKNMNPEEFVANVDYLRYIEEENKIEVYNKRSGKVSVINVEPEYAPACEIGDSAAYIFCRLTPRENWEGGGQQLRVYRRSGEIVWETPINDADKVYFSNNGRYLVYSTSAYGANGIVADFSAVDLDEGKRNLVDVLQKVPLEDYGIRVCSNGAIAFNEDGEIYVVDSKGKTLDTVATAFGGIPSYGFDCEGQLIYYGGKSDVQVKNVGERQVLRLESPEGLDFDSRTLCAIRQSGKLAVKYQLSGGQSRVYIYDLRSGEISGKEYGASVQIYSKGSNLVVDDGERIQIWSEK